jgi:2-isopropylmalate synthase
MPWVFAELISYVMATVRHPERALFSVHCHNDLGMATANSLAAVMAGARRVECTINGIGERAGNTSLEEVVMLLRVRQAALGLECGIDTTEIARTSRLVCELTDTPVQPNKAIVGANAFAHASGIHQDGVLKDALNYEIMKPEDVGLTSSRIVLTARSGRHAFKHRLAVLGIAVPDERLAEAWERFLNVADSKREVSDDDLVRITSELMQTA